MNKVIAVCTSKEKGVRKQVVAEVQLKENFGVIGDAHAECNIRRQVSLLAIESIAKMKQHGLNLSPGDFAENITTEGINLVSIPVGTKVAVGDKVVLEISQIGKECHTGCAIKKQVGKCIMPVEGVFGKVIKGGPIKAGDEIKII